MKGLAFLFLVCLVRSAFADAHAEWQYRTSSPTQIRITQNAASDSQSSGAGEEDCRVFRLTPKLVRAYFRKARAVESTRGYQWSGCKASGSIVFANGDRGTWQINSSRLGFLTLEDGRSFAFFCRDTACREPVYRFWAGVNADGEWADEEERRRQ